MTNEEYSNLLKPYISELELYIDHTQLLAENVIGNSLIKSDICFIAMMDRSVELAKGMISMLNERNLTCAGGLLRLQVDNCLRLYAFNIAEDEEGLADVVINGGRIRDHKDRSGEKMTDKNLAKKIKEEGYDENIVDVYDLLSGFIHFSENGIIQSIVENTDDGFTAKIGATLPDRFNGVLLSIAKDSIRYYKLFLFFMTGAADRKKKMDESDEIIRMG